MPRLAARRLRLLCALTLGAATAMAAVPVGVADASTPGDVSPPVAAAEQRAGIRTSITLTTRGCSGCTVTPIQVRRDSIVYHGRPATTSGTEDTLTFAVPTKRTQNMGFTVQAPYSNLGLTIAVTKFRAKDPGDPVSTRYASKARQASGCWTGTKARAVSNTLVIRKVKVRYPIAGPGRYDAAEAHLTKTLRSTAPFRKFEKNAYVPTEADICR